jgi:tetratricopeptide (TPR) repeat protein
MKWYSAWAFALVFALSVPAAAQETSVAEMVTSGKTALKAKNWVKAEATFREALSRDGTSQDAWRGLGKAQVGRKQWDAAIETYNKGLVAIPDWHRALYQLGYVYRKKADYGRAIEYYEKYIAVAPDNPDGYFGLGQSHRKNGDDGKALVAFRSYVEKEKRPAEQKWVDRAKEIISSLEETASDEPEEEVAAAEDETPIVDGDLGSLVERADLAYQENNLPLASRLYRGAAKLDETGFEAHYKLGVVLALRGDLAGAIRAWETVVAREPEMERARTNMERARKKLASQRDKGVDDAALHGSLEEQLELAGRYLDEGRNVMALRVLDPLADEHPEDGRVRLARGKALALAGRYDEARTDLELSLAGRPGDPAVLDALGRLYLRTGDGGRARYFLQRYLERVDPARRQRDLDPTREIVAKLEAEQ